VDRDLILAGLIVTGASVTLLAAGQWPAGLDLRASARAGEREAWRSLWWPLALALVVACVFIGWAIMEPAESDEHLPSSVVVSALLFVASWARAAVRAVAALTRADSHVAGTVGLWRPTIVISNELVARVDRDALEAVLAHEGAHVRHRDPLRIWLAQIVTDLQWPFPGARRRFDRWRHVLELARDEEVRVGGVDGADLASAILAAARLLTRSPQGAGLIHTRVGLETRITRLLAPLPAADEAVTAVNVLVLIPVPILALLCGVHFGEPIVQGLAKWLP
jgi:hypothetical protein